jgi:ADP-ribose pyrophosphatase
MPNHESMKPKLTPWRVLDSRLLLDCAPWFRVVADDVLLPGGERVENYYRIEAPDFVMIFPLSDDGRVLALRGYKHGAGRVMCQLPAGYMDRANESPLSCAQRELLEETGYTANEWRSLGRLSVDGNRGLGHAHLFLARGLCAFTTPDSGDLETLVLQWLSIEELHRLWRTGEFDNTAATAIIGLALEMVGDDNSR